MLGTLVRDVRYGIRQLRRSPGFTAVAVLTLGLGIAANTTVFSWIDSVLLQPIPGVRNAQELAALEEVMPEGGSSACTHPDFRDFQHDLGSVAGVTATHFAAFSIGRKENARRVFGQVVSANFFEVLGVQPYLGRTFSSQEDRDAPGAFPLAVISYRLWHSHFGADPDVIGKTERVNGHQLTIVGVTPPDFRGTMGGLTFDIWVPLSMILETGSLNTWAADDRNARFLDVLVRLKPGVHIGQARAEVKAVAARIAKAYPQTHSGVTATVVPLWRAHTGAQSLLLDPLRILMAVCILVLLIACANVANLLLARSVTRQRELSIRMALGATRRRVMQQLLVEVLLLAGAGAIFGAWLARWLAQSLMYLLPRTDLPIAVGGSFLSWRVLSFTVLICFGAAVLAAMMPMLHSGHVPLNESLKAGGRSGTSSLRSHRARGLLVGFEIALAAVALIGAGLFVRSFRNAQVMHPGFEARNVLIAHLYLSSAGYLRDQEVQFDRTLCQRLEGGPGIEQVTYADWVPLWFGNPPWEMLRIEGYARSREAGTPVFRTLVGPGYFHLLHIPLLAGREFTDQDDEKAPRVMIVNQTFARRFFQGQDPLGRRVHFDYCDCWHTIVGLAQDSKESSPSEPPTPFVYAPFRQMFGRGHNSFIYVRTRGNPNTARATLRHEVAALDPTADLFDAMPLTEYTQSALYPQKVAAILLASLGILSMLLAAVGLYSVMSYAVSERTQEIGIRMALGASRRDVHAMVFGKSLAMTATGLLGGVLAALALTRLVSSLLVEVSAADPLTFVAAILFLLGVALVATYVPARRATKVDPMVAWRYE